MTVNETQKPAPISAAERIVEIDILRGFALFGILLVNMLTFSDNFYEYIMLRDPVGSVIDQAAVYFIKFFGEAKFFSLFSFLFGFGLVIQMWRAEARGTKFVPLYLRRVFVLLIIGLIHTYLIWVGDILVSYAVLGALLLLFRKARPRTLLIWSIAMLVLLSLVNFGLAGMFNMARQSPGGEAMVAEMIAQSEEGYRQAGEQATRVYATGTIGEIIAQRAADFEFMRFATLFIYPNIFAMFLLGLAAGKQGIFQNIQAHLPLFRKLQIWGLVVGILGNVVYVVVGNMVAPAIPSFTSAIAFAGQAFGAPMLTAFYLSTIVLAAQNPVWRRWLMPLAPLGRMALTNYLMQSIVATLIFNSYGLGLFGQVGPAAGILITLVIYAAQIPLSMWWMSHFYFGPVEWLWRALTYGKLPRFRCETPSVQLAAD